VIFEECLRNERDFEGDVKRGEGSSEARRDPVHGLGENTVRISVNE